MVMRSIFSKKHDNFSDMSKIDRLSALIQNFDLRVFPTDPDEANLLIFENAENQTPTRVVFAPLCAAHTAAEADETLSFAAQADWGGATNPFLSALPAEVTLRLDAEPEVIHILKALQNESATPRCGGSAVLDRLGEVLLIRLLRLTIERGATDVGLLAGLADPRLSRAIVAMHDEPGRKWQGDDLARHAGLSQSRFSELFRAKVGETPGAYLRRWRMVLARQDAERGERVQTIARRYGYGSPEALSRAFKRAHNQPAIALRPSA